MQVLTAFAGDLLEENDAPKIAPLRRGIRKLADREPVAVFDETLDGDEQGELDENSEAAGWREELTRILFGVQCRQAQDKGVWEDGRPFDAEAREIKPLYRPIAA